MVFCSGVMSVRSHSVTYLSCVMGFCSAVMSVRADKVTYLSCVMVFCSAVMSVRSDCFYLPALCDGVLLCCDVCEI